jgi:hypothetical protein
VLRFSLSAFHFPTRSLIFRLLPAPIRLVSSLAVEADSFSVDLGATALFGLLS